MYGLLLSSRLRGFLLVGRGLRPRRGRGCALQCALCFALDGALSAAPAALRLFLLRGLFFRGPFRGRFADGSLFPLILRLLCGCRSFMCGSEFFFAARLLSRRPRRGHNPQGLFAIRFGQVSLGNLLVGDRDLCVIGQV